jgi:predicted enzyme related to lactoylglutathione lyase
MSERDGYAPGVPCWVDTWQPDADGAARFYAELFGWEAARGEYSLFRLRGRDVAGVAGSADDTPAWTTDVEVADADATAERAVAAGGSLLREPFASLDGGRMALFADPAGAVLAAWQLGEHRGAQLVNEHAAWAMSVLRTPDTESAAAFYRAVFGWETEAFGPAALFRLPGFVGGEPAQPVPRDVVAVMMPGEAAAWTPDFWVHEVDAVAAKAAALGGTVVAPPTDMGPSRVAVLADPQGAVFSVSRAAPAA